MQQKKHVANHRMSDGSKRSVELSFKDSYKDEDTSATLPHGHICSAMADEIGYLTDHVLKVVPTHETSADLDGKLVGGP